MSRQFLRFVVVGGLAAVVNLVSRYFFSSFVTYEWAVALAFPCGLLTAFILSRSMVFEPSGRGVRYEFGWFLAINLAALVQVWGISVGLVRWGFPAIGFEWHPEEVAHLIGVGTPMITSYLGHKYLTFRAVNEDAGSAEK